MTTIVKIMVDESLPPGTIRVAPRIVVAPSGDEGLVRAALGNIHKTVYCSNGIVGDKVREVVKRTEGVEEA